MAMKDIGKIKAHADGCYKNRKNNRRAAKVSRAAAKVAIRKGE
jgi:hypothetical protein